MMTRLLVVDAQPIVRLGLRALFANTADVRWVGECDNGHAAQRALDELQVDAVILDALLPGESLSSVVAELKRHRPTLRVLLLGEEPNTQLAVEGLAAGAGGLALKRQPSDMIAYALRTVLAGQRYLPPGIDVGDVAELTARRSRGGSTSPMDLLSQRERDVFQLHTRGMSAKQIASTLFISEKTVQTHRANIFRKLHVHSGIELMRFAAVNNLLQMR